MDSKLALLILVLIAVAVDWSEADFNYNRMTPTQEEFSALKLNCLPGRTYIKIETAKAEDNSEDEDYEDGRRTHMNSKPTASESCKICMCSVNGKDEYCTTRPAMNVNECIRMGHLMSNFKKNKPFDHERSLSQRIRRDLIWHYNEIPYDPDARCVRGQTFYTNQKATKLLQVNITWHQKVDNLLDYELSSSDEHRIVNSKESFNHEVFGTKHGQNRRRADQLFVPSVQDEVQITRDEQGNIYINGTKSIQAINPVPDDLPDICKNKTKVGDGKNKGGLDDVNPCYFCICSVSGNDMTCIPRDVYFCDYYKSLRKIEAGDTLIGTEDPAYMNQAYKKRMRSSKAYQPYFRHISYRVRRTMDDGIFDFIDSGGDALCCDHPDGHRRAIHNIVKSRIRSLRKKVPKENLMSNAPGGDYVDFVVNNDK